jgi:hypothetical protein
MIPTLNFWNWFTIHGGYQDNNIPVPPTRTVLNTGASQIISTAPSVPISESITNGSLSLSVARLYPNADANVQIVFLIQPASKKPLYWVGSSNIPVYAITAAVAPVDWISNNQPPVFNTSSAVAPKDTISTPNPPVDMVISG